MCRVFSSNFYFSPLALQKLWKRLFVSSKKLIWFSRYSFFCIPVLPSFSFSLESDNCLNKNSITHFVRYPEKEKSYDIETLSLDGISDKKHFYKLVPDLFIILVNNPKQPFHARNYFKSKIFWKRIIKKP